MGMSGRDYRPQPNRNFLRKGMGNGGSSTRFEVGVLEQDGSRKRIAHGGSISPMRAHVPVFREQKATVRIRRNDGYEYAQGSLYGKSMKSMHQTMHDDESRQNLLWEMKRAK